MALEIDSVGGDPSGSINLDLGDQLVSIQLSNSPNTIASVVIDGITQVIDSQTPGASDTREVVINVTGYISDGANTLKVSE